MSLLTLFLFRFFMYKVEKNQSCSSRYINNNKKRGGGNMHIINGKMTTNCIFDLKYRISSQKKFSWIYMNSINVNVYNEDTNYRYTV